jgi:hypothetical protein
MNCVFDDSGGVDTSFLCIAGYAGLDDGWAALSDEWLMCLAKHNIPYVHMKYLIPMRRPYADLGWDFPKRNEVLCEFAEIVKRRAICGFAVAVDVAHWRAMESGAKKRIGDPRRFCVIRLIKMITERFSKIAGFDDHLTLFFDDSEEMSVEYHGIVKELRKLPEYKKIIGGVCFADDELYNPLQAADLLAWETTKELGQRLAGYASRREFKKLMGLEQPALAMPYMGKLYGPEALDDVAKKSNKPE